MKNNIKRIVLFSIILFALSTLFIRVNAVTIIETTDTNDMRYDKIIDNSVIIGNTRFSPQTIITAKRAATAGADDLKVFLAMGGEINDYEKPKLYYYLAKSWFVINEDGSIEPIEPIYYMEIYFVDNNPKTEIDIVNEEQKEEKESNNIYTVTFNSDGGTSIDSQEVLKGTMATKPSNNPIKIGYEFIDWYKDNEIFDFSSIISEDLILTAKYRKLGYKIIMLEPENGEVYTNPNFNVQPGSTVEIIANPKDGYEINSIKVETYNGMNIEVKEDNFFIMPDDNVAIIVQFTPKEIREKNTVNNEDIYCQTEETIEIKD